MYALAKLNQEDTTPTREEKPKTKTNRHKREVGFIWSNPGGIYNSNMKPSTIDIW